jgi:hypothetical protein
LSIALLQTLLKSGKYNLQKRESHQVKVARIAYHWTQKALLRYSHPKSPHPFTLPN